MTLDDFLEKLEGVKRGGAGFVAICPAHDDREASLGITEGDDRILLNCHAGCETQSVLDALSLQWSDLFTNARNYAEPEEVYDYVDETGRLLFQSLRFPGKKFRQRHKDDEGKWVGNLDGVRRVLYRLPEVVTAVAAGQPVAICEGEKDVEAFRTVGVTATCNPMGAGKWKPEFNEFFREANAIIVADKDEPGRKHAETVKTGLQGVAKSIQVVQAKKGKDAYDHLVLHKLPKEDFEPVRQSQVSRRGVVTARELAQQGRDDLELNEHDIPGFILIDPVPVKFRLGRIYACGAYTGDGKTTLAVQGTRKLCTEGRRGTYFTLEMPERDLRNKLLAHRGIPLALLEEPWRLRSNAVMYQAYLDGLEEIGSWNLDVIFDGSMTAEKAAEIVRERDSEFVVVDHVHRQAATKERASLEEQIRGYTNMALEQNVMVILLCQLREPRIAQSKDIPMYPVPTLQSFRETGVIGQEASIAFSIWRQRDAAGISYVGDTTTLTVLKNRHTTGREDQTGKQFFVNFDHQRQMFVSAPPTIPVQGVTV